MPVATVVDVRIDAADPVLVARFWGGLLGLDVEVLDSGGAVVRDAVGRTALRVDGGAGPRTGKNRVHLDLESADPPAGAAHLADRDGFAVRADPEGGAFCVFPGAGPARVTALVTDSADPVPIAAWWAGLTGAEVVPGPDAAPRWLRGAAGLGGAVWKFVPVPDPRPGRDRWHWDVRAHVPDLVAAGARVLRGPEGTGGRTLLVDPDGNEFRASVPPP